MTYPVIAYAALRLLSGRGAIALDAVAVALIVGMAAWRQMLSQVPVGLGLREYLGASVPASASLVFQRLLAFILATLAACAITLLLLHAGVARAEPLPGQHVEVAATIGWYARELADAVPFLEIPRTLNWEERYAFADLPSRVFLLLLKINLALVLILPVRMLAKLYSERRAKPSGG